MSYPILFYLILFYTPYPILFYWIMSYMPQLTSNTFLFAHVLHFLSYLIPFKYVLRVLYFSLIFRSFLHVLSYIIMLNSELHVLYYPNLFNPILNVLSCPIFSSFSYLYIQYILFNAVLLEEDWVSSPPPLSFNVLGSILDPIPFNLVLTSLILSLYFLFWIFISIWTMWNVFEKKIFKPRENIHQTKTYILH